MFELPPPRDPLENCKIQTFTKHLLVANFSAYHCARNSRSAFQDKDRGYGGFAEWKSEVPRKPNMKHVDSVQWLSFSDFCFPF